MDTVWIPTHNYWGESIQSIINVKEQSDVLSFLEGASGDLFSKGIKVGRLRTHLFFRCKINKLDAIYEK